MVAPLLRLLGNAPPVLPELYSLLKSRPFQDEAGRRAAAGSGCGQHALDGGGPGQRPVGAGEAGSVGAGS